jgi:hypothetical protein
MVVLSMRFLHTMTIVNCFGRHPATDITDARAARAGHHVTREDNHDRRAGHRERLSPAAAAGSLSRRQHDQHNQEQHGLGGRQPPQSRFRLSEQILRVDKWSLCRD